MLRNKTILASALAAFLVCACTHYPPRPEWDFGRYHFNYLIEGNGRVKLLQVFDDEKHTYFQLELPANSLPVVRKPDGRKNLQLKVSKHGLLYRVEGLHSSLQISLSGAPARSACAYRIYRQQR